MFKRLSTIGLAIAITLLASPAVAELAFTGGLMRVSSTINPNQELATDTLTGTQEVLDAGNSLGITTEAITSRVGGNQMLTRSMSAVASQSIAQRQTLGGTRGTDAVSSGLQRTLPSVITVASSDTMAFGGNAGNVQLSANSGINPTFTTAAGLANTLTSGTTPAMSIGSSFTGTLTSPGGTGLAALSLVATGPAAGTATFTGSVNGVINRASEFGNIAGNSLYTGEMANLAEIVMTGVMTVGTQ